MLSKLKQALQNVLPTYDDDGTEGAKLLAELGINYNNDVLYLKWGDAARVILLLDILRSLGPRQFWMAFRLVLEHGQEWPWQE